MSDMDVDMDTNAHDTSPGPDPNLDIIRLHSEVYNSEAMLEAHEEINSLPQAANDDLERVVAPLMVWSDSTHLTNFGDASLWPFYLYFGNQSKYTRAKPTADACNHLAYIPTVSTFLLLALLSNLVISSSQMGFKTSLKKARKLIFRRNRAVNSKAVDKALGLRSEIPTQVSLFIALRIAWFTIYLI
jgi:Plavaka transposase